MSKREISQVGASVEGETARKRRKEQDSPETGQGGGGSSSGEDVRSQGMKLWNIVKDATSKDGRILSSEFMRKPNRRMYADYYSVITSPIALEDIRKSIEGGTYSSLDMIKAAFELCFTNAMTYNLDGSQIYQDAKELKKIMNKAYNKMNPSARSATGDSKEPKEPKAPSLTRLIKSRLQKLVELTDDEGRLRSTEFQELPDRKIWAIYYEHIKHPISFEMIFKKIKRKEYETSQQFADDVELMFSNAFSFNESNTPIWQDAKALQTKFHELMSDMPAPFALTKHAKQASQPSTKLTLKVPPVAIAPPKPANAPSTSTAPPPSPKVIKPPQPPPPTHPTPTAPPPPAQSVATTPKAPTPIQAPHPTSINPSGILVLDPTASGAVPGLPKMTNTAVPKTRPQSVVPTPSPQPQHLHHHHLANANPYRPSPPPAISLPPPAPVLPSNATISKTPATKTALTLPKPRQPLKCATVKVEPSGRSMELRHEEGVEAWMMRVGPMERGLAVSGLVFLEDDDDDEDPDRMDVDEPKVPQKRGRGRPPKNPVAPPKPLPKKSKQDRIIEAQVKLNTVVIPEKEENLGVWYMELPVGSNTVEMGSKDGSAWKLYIDRAEPRSL